MFSLLFLNQLSIFLCQVQIHKALRRDLRTLTIASKFLSSVVFLVVYAPWSLFVNEKYANETWSEGHIGLAGIILFCQSWSQIGPRGHIGPEQYY